MSERGRFLLTRSYAMVELLYTAVFQNGHILGEYAASQRDTREMARAISLQAKRGTMLSYTINDLAGHYIAPKDARQLVMVSICESSTPRRLAFDTLKEIERRLDSYGDSTPGAMELSNQIKDICVKLRDREDNLISARDDIEQVRNVMVDNIDRLLERGERIGLLVDRTSEMNTSAGIFRHRAGQVSRKMWWQNMRITVFAILAVLAFLVLIYLMLRPR